MRSARFISPLIVGLLLGGVTPSFAETTTCTGTIGAVQLDNVVVPDGRSCTLNRTRLKGNIVVGTGATLTATGVRVNGNIQAEGARAVFVKPATTVGGSIQIVKGGTARIDRAWINGDLQLFENRGRLRASGNFIGGNLQVVSNTGGVLLTDNDIEGAMQCKQNTPPRRAAATRPGTRRTSALNLPHRPGVLGRPRTPGARRGAQPPVPSAVLGLRHANAVLLDLLIERAPGNPEPLGRSLDTAALLLKNPFDVDRFELPEREIRVCRGPRGGERVEAQVLRRQDLARRSAAPPARARSAARGCCPASDSLQRSSAPGPGSHRPRPSSAPKRSRTGGPGSGCPRPVAERRDDQRDRADPEVEVAAEPLLAGRAGEVLVGGGDQADVDLAVAESPTRRNRFSSSTFKSFGWTWGSTSPISSRKTCRGARPPAARPWGRRPP